MALMRLKRIDAVFAFRAASRVEPEVRLKLAMVLNVSIKLIQTILGYTM